MTQDIADLKQLTIKLDQQIESIRKLMTCVSDLRYATNTRHAIGVVERALAELTRRIDSDTNVEDNASLRPRIEAVEQWMKALSSRIDSGIIVEGWGELVARIAALERIVDVQFGDEGLTRGATLLRLAAIERATGILPGRQGNARSQSLRERIDDLDARTSHLKDRI